MIKTLTVTNYVGDILSLELANPSHGLAITSIDGLGPVNANVAVTDITSGDGGVFNSARIGIRNIVVTFLLLENPTIEATRLSLYKYFPTKKKIKMVIGSDSRTVSIEGYVESVQTQIFSKQEVAQVSVICPDPYFYSYGEGSGQIIEFSSDAAKFVFPFHGESPKNLIFGEISQLANKMITYNGDAEIGITIEMNAYDTATNVTFYNDTRSEFIGIDTAKLATLTGQGIISGDTIRICTVKGKKEITLLRSGVTTNILNCLTKNSTWIQCQRGDNVFYYTADSGSSNLTVTITVDVIYEGI